jgi:hypothetical protein
MLTGSLASSFHGEPRSTRDIDIVIDPPADALLALVHRLQAEGMYVDEAAAAGALRDRGQFNAIATDAKVDFVIRKDRPFSRTEFDRRQRVRLPGVDAHVVTVEDLVIAKLEWASETGSDRQRRDVTEMIAISGDALDGDYVERWANELGLSDDWATLKAEAAGPD